MSLGLIFRRAFEEFRPTATRYAQFVLESLLLDSGDAAIVVELVRLEIIRDRPSLQRAMKGGSLRREYVVLRVHLRAIDMLKERSKKTLSA